MNLLTVVEKVIDDCAQEWEFHQFVSAVYEGEGWEWIFARRGLKGVVMLPANPTEEVQLSGPEAEWLVHRLVVTKGWSMRDYDCNGHAISTFGNINTGRSYFVRLLVKELGKGIAAARYSSTNPMPGKSLASLHETGITLTSITHGGGYPAYRLAGDTSRNWHGLQTAEQRFLAFLDEESHVPPSKRLSKLNKTQADQKFYTLDTDSGGSCLLGAMVADIANAFGQVLRVVSFTGNMMRHNKVYSAQTTRKQEGDQTHMEIFQFERLGVLLRQILAADTISSIDIAILGLKTNKVVSENAMCDACQGAQATNLDNVLQGRTDKMKLDVSFLSIA